MDSLEEVINFLLGLIDAASVSRIIYCIIKANSDNDEIKSYLKRIRHIFMFIILTNCVWVVKALVEYYYKE